MSRLKFELKENTSNIRNFFLLILSILIFTILLGFIKYYYVSPPKIIPLNSSAYFEWGNCDFDKPILSTIHCGNFYTATDDATAKIQHKLPVVLIRPFSLFRKHSPIIYFSGGPGGSNRLNSEGIENWLTWLKENKWERDFFIYEQRGIGGSAPSYSCPGLIKKHKEYVSLNLSVVEELELFDGLLKKCYENLIEDGADLHNLNTIRNAEDALGIMSSLDYEKWNVYGVSYGTKIAMEVLRQDESHIRSVVLDSVYPKHIISLNEWPKLLFENMRKIINACESIDECNEKYENFHLVFDMVIEKLKDKPDEIVIKDYFTDEDVKYVLTDSRLLDILFNATYSHWSVEIIPMMLTDYFDGKTELIKETIENAMYDYWDETFSDPVFISVECHDNIFISKLEFNTSVDAYPETSEYVRNFWEYDACHFWDSGKPMKEFYNEKEPSVSVLILATKYDPITPTEWASSMHKMWPSSYLIEMERAGHSVVDNTLCGAWIVSDFFDDPTTEPVSECLSDSEYNSISFY